MEREMSKEENLTYAIRYLHRAVEDAESAQGMIRGSMRQQDIASAATNAEAASKLLRELEADNK
jgi:hypothetical protein